MAKLRRPMEVPMSRGSPPKTRCDPPLASSDLALVFCTYIKTCPLLCPFVSCTGAG